MDHSQFQPDCSTQQSDSHSFLNTQDSPMRLLLVSPIHTNEYLGSLLSLFGRTCSNFFVDVTYFRLSINSRSSIPNSAGPVFSTILHRACASITHAVAPRNRNAEPRTHLTLSSKSPKSASSVARVALNCTIAAP